ncbi:hypothetical protein BDZ89DRAFT_1129622 [Hymenopellis radicata]|nr:hypothetical protein BDZ89DRAFT_1129622 [Hymenopellis radicata]
MSANDAQPLSEQYGLNEAGVKYVLSTTLNTFCFVVYTGVYILSMYQILFTSRQRIVFNKQRKALAGTITLLWAILTMRVGCVWHFLNATFIDAAATREDEFVWMYGPRGPVPVETFGSVTLFAMILVADLIMIWRSWAIYARSWTAIVLPILTMTTGSAAVSIQLSLDYLPAPSDEAFEVGDIPLLWKIDWNTIYFAMIVVTNSLCTLLIVGRIIFLIGWRPALKTYRGIVTIILESALLYSGAFIIRIGMVTSLDEDSWNSSSLYVDALLPSITCLAPTLVIVLVLAGHSTPAVSHISPPSSLPPKPLPEGTLDSRVHFIRKMVLW